MFYDATVGGIDPLSSSTGASGGPQGGINERDVSGCEIRANLAGFQSDSIILGFRRSLDNPDIGTIRIHRLANVEGYTFSVTTAQAPKDARKAYEKGLELLNKRKWAEAERELTRAVGSYPKYAAAWHERRDLPVRIRPRTEAFTLPAPGDLQLVDVRRIDLIQRRILGAGGIAPIPTPFAVYCSTLRARVERPPNQKTQRNKNCCPGSSRHDRQI